MHNVLSSQLKFSLIWYDTSCSPVLIAKSHHECAVIAKLYRIVQSSADDRKRMILTGRKQTSALSSKLWVQTWRSLAVHTVSVNSAKPCLL